jgi:DNA-binding CsgD family transcriptional regulator
LAVLGQADRAITLALEARAIAEDLDDAETVIGTYQAITFVLKLVGRERDVLEEARQGYQRARELGLERATGSFVANNLASSLLDTGRWTECERLTRELLAGDRWGVFNLHNALGRLLIRRGQVADAQRRAIPILAALDRLATARTPQAHYPPVTAHLQAAQAEQSRLEGRSDPGRWRTAAAAWERLEYPYDAAYARFREAEALLAAGGSRQQAETALRAAHQTTVALGAGPLRREIELLAQRGRLRLKEPEDTTAAPAAPPSPAASFGLTRREAEVLALVAEGRTNQQIGQALFITPKTASVHVSRILAKLGVAGRGEAAAVAHRLGLDKP